MIEPAIARDTYVVPALNKLGLYSLEAEKLLMGTAAIESNFQNFVQFGGGPARGMFQMEPATFDDILDRFLGEASHAALKAAVVSTATASPPAFSELTANHLFAAAMARAKYYSIAAAIPAGLNDQANYWWTYYNGRAPHGLKPDNYLASWNTYCAALYP
jgi:hypothetical protein